MTMLHGDGSDMNNRK